MKTLAALLFTLVTFHQGAGLDAGQSPTPREPSSSVASTSSIHHLRDAHELTMGSGVRVGILDHSFEIEAHPDLYAGHVVFGEEARGTRDRVGSQRGFWMALTLREVAPEASIFALDLAGDDKQARVDALVRALRWAIDHDLDVVTYCGGDLSDAGQEHMDALDAMVDKAVEAGVTVAFVGYSHPSNLLPGGFGPSVRESLREPDLNIFSDDCTSLLAGRFTAFVDPDDDTVLSQRPFLAQPAIGPVAAGLAALVKSANPAAGPLEVKNILVDTSRPMVYQGRRADRVPDAFLAVRRAVATRSDP
jgi:hypothetical protein